MNLVSKTDLHIVEQGGIGWGLSNQQLRFYKIDCGFCLVVCLFLLEKYKNLFQK